MKTAAVLLFVYLLAGSMHGQVPAECYRLDTLEMPPNREPGVTGLAFAPDGRLAVCFRRGSIWLLETKTLEWEPFASGLFWPLGILPGGPGEFFVVQIPELTRVVDTDSDGKADLFETISDDWGLSGNYHEFTYGPVRDDAGNFYVALGCASARQGLRPPLRGEATDRSSHLPVYAHHSPVAYRGWVLKISPAGDVTPVAGGLRQPNGLGLNAAGDLFVTDNQGDWVGTSPLHHVTPGAFHGHASSLIWRTGFTGYPDELPVEEIQALRKLPAVQFPQGDLAASSTQPLLDTTQGRFGPYTGQFFIADYTLASIYRVSLEKVRGEYQGACFPFVEGHPLRRGNLRLAFSPDGALYVGQCSRPWQGAPEGIQRLVWTGKVPMDILAMRLHPDGFELTFTKAVDQRTASRLQSYSMQRYYYESTVQYGSPKHEPTAVEVKRVDVSADGLRVVLVLDDLVPRRIYELRTRGLESRDGEKLVTRLAAYTLNNKLE